MRPIADDLGRRVDVISMSDVWRWRSMMSLWRKDASKQSNDRSSSLLIVVEEVEAIVGLAV